MKILFVFLLLSICPGVLLAQSASDAAPETPPPAKVTPAVDDEPGDASSPAEPGAADGQLPEPVDGAADDATGSRVSTTVAEPEKRIVGVEEIRRFVSVYRAVKQAYVDDVDDAELMGAAIRGLLIDLDPHSAYLDQDESQALNEQAFGVYDGLGLEVVQQPDRSLLIIAPIDDTPAARAGILPGDIISRIDGEAVTADSVDSAVESMRGEAGTKIRLTILRDGEPEPLELTLTRETIRVASTRAERLETDFGYLRISTFQAETGREVQRRVDALIGENGRPLKGLVLDLRRNPGGLLNSAVEVADAFLDSGLIVSTKGRLGHANAEFNATRGDLLDGAPIVVLLDSGSASAAEVLAGALSDHRRALVMGTTSFGKGSVQTVLPLDNGDAIKLTTARYYTPNGTSIQATGIVPDIELDEGVVLGTRDNRPPTVRERDLPGHLRGERESDEGVSSSDARSAALDDYAVGEALNLLKGLQVFGPRPASG